MRRVNLKAKVLVLLSLLFCSQFIILAYASDGSKVTTFQIGSIGSRLCDVVVHFSWDSDSWKVGDKHSISFSFEAKNVNPNVVDLNLNINEIIIRLKSGIFYHTVDLISNDVSNQVTQLVYRQGSTTMFNTPRSFSYEVETPKPDEPITDDTNVKLYYLIRLSGNFYYQEGSGTGSGQIFDYISNEGSMSGGIEDPVWITMKGEPSFPWLYIAIAGAGISAGAIGLSAFLIVRKRKLKAKLTSLQ